MYSLKLGSLVRLVYCAYARGLPGALTAVRRAVGSAARGWAGRGSRWRRQRLPRGWSGLRHRLLLSPQPLLEVSFAFDFEHDRHEAVITAAQLGALAAISADLVRIDIEPGLVDESRARVFLDGKCRHPRGM